MKQKWLKYSSYKVMQKQQLQKKKYCSFFSRRPEQQIQPIEKIIFFLKNKK